MKRFSLLLGCLVVFCLCIFVISQARNHNTLPTLAKGIEGRPALPVLVARQLPVAISIGTYAATGLPVALSVGPVNSDKGFAELPCRLSLTGGREVRSINLALFEVEPTGKLRGVEGWTQSFDDQKAGGQFFDFPLRPQRSLEAKGALVLALESVSGTDGSWQIDFTELMQTVVAKVGGRPDAQAAVRQNNDPRSGDYGSNYCSRAFALAFHLSKFSDAVGTPAFTCDQQTRAFAASYLPGKTATAPQ